MEAVAVLGLLADDVEHGVDELGALGVVALGPVVAGVGLAEDEVVGAEDLAVGAGTHEVHERRTQRTMESEELRVRWGRNPN